MAKKQEQAKNAIELVEFRKIQNPYMSEPSHDDLLQSGKQESEVTCIKTIDGRYILADVNYTYWQFKRDVDNDVKSDTDKLEVHVVRQEMTEEVDEAFIKRITRKKRLTKETVYEAVRKMWIENSRKPKELQESSEAFATRICSCVTVGNRNGMYLHMVRTCLLAAMYMKSQKVIRLWLQGEIYDEDFRKMCLMPEADKDAQEAQWERMKHAGDDYCRNTDTPTIEGRHQAMSRQLSEDLANNYGINYMNDKTSMGFDTSKFKHELLKRGITEADADAIVKLHTDVQLAQHNGCPSAGILYCLTWVHDAMLKYDFIIDDQNKDVIHPKNDTAWARKVGMIQRETICNRIKPIETVMPQNFIDFLVVVTDAAEAEKRLIFELKRLGGQQCKAADTGRSEVFVVSRSEVERVIKEIIKDFTNDKLTARYIAFRSKGLKVTNFKDEEETD